MKIGYLMQKGEEIRKPPYNGPANHVRHIVQELERLGHTVWILFRMDGGLWLSEGLQQFRMIQAQRMDQSALRLVERVVRRSQSALRLPYFAYFDSLRFALACQQELSDCDVFLERMSWMMSGGTWAARRLRIPLVLEYNGDPLADLEAKGIEPRGVQRRIAMRAMKTVIRSADRIVATGEGWRDSCIQKWGARPDQMVVIENGTDLIHILSRNQLRCFQPEDQKPRRRTLVYLGGFYAWHGISVLLDVFVEVIQHTPNVELLLIGAGPGESEARSLAASNGLQDHVRFLGQMSAEQYAPILAQADLGLSPYCGWPEYSGLKIFDYKAAGLAIIASGEDGHPVTLKHGQTGWIVPPCDRQALAEGVCYLLSHPDLCRQMGQQARIEAEELHGWEHTARRMEEVLLSLAKQ
jgi:glycosyltransferase involved in cell wall biosynthesis